jgi:hypothetical protein
MKVTNDALRVATYRARSTLHHRWAGYLALVVLTGLLGGVAMGSVAAARRTQSSYPVYLASTNPSQEQFFTEFAPITRTGYSASLDAAVAKLRYVKRSEEVIGFDGNLQILEPVKGNAPAGEAPPSVEGSTNGEFVSVDRVIVLQGRMPDAARDNEFVMSAGGAAEEGLHIGSTLRVGFFTDAQTASPHFAGYPTDKPHLAVTLKLVGIVEDSFQIVQDDDAAALGNQFAVLSPALTRQLAACCAYYSLVAVQIEGGTRHQGAVQAEMDKVLPDIGPFAGAQTNAPFVAKAEQAVRPEAIAFGVFALLCGLAALLISGQVVGRLVRRTADDESVLRALGAGPAMTTADALVGIICSVVAGALVAVALAVALSPLAPIGAVRLGARRCACALRPARRRARGGGGRRHLDNLWGQPQLPCVASRPLRLELELCAVVGLLGRRGPTRDRDRRPAQPRQGGRPLGRRLLRDRSARRASRTGPRRGPERLGEPAAVVRARPTVRARGGAWDFHIGNAPQTCRRYGSRQRRPWVSCPLADRRDGDPAYDRGLG